MGKTLSFLNSTVGRKIIMGLSGLFLCSFLVVHLAINLFSFEGRDGRFEPYGHFMATHPVVRPLEWVLFAGFLIHAFVGIALALYNRSIRPVRYEENKASDNSTWVSRLSWLTGIFVGVFLVVHVNTFFVQSRFFGREPMYDILAEAFSSPGYVAFYMIALIFLAYHLKHGLQSAFQTFGLRAGKYRGLIDFIGLIFWLIIPVGFAIIPLYFLFLQ